MKFLDKEGWNLIFPPNDKVVKGEKPGVYITLASWRYLPVNYFFHNQFVSEEKMLRFIKLKAFL